MTKEASPPPLAGTVVLSIGHTLPGLHCLAALRDLGAEVIRIERPTAGDVRGQYAGVADAFPIRSLIAGTHSLELNLKLAAGAAAFRRMAERVAVVLEGFRPGVAHRLGIDYETLRVSNPALVYAAITGYGQAGPDRDRAGHDINYLAETGVLGLSNPLGLPGVTFADGMAGLGAALNVVAAVHGASRSGEGQLLDCAIIDGPLQLMASELEHYWRTGQSRGAGATHLTGRHAWYDVHATADGRAVAVGAVEPPFFDALWRGLGDAELDIDQFAESEAREAARETITTAFASRTRDEALELFANEEACVSPVRDTAEVAESALMDRALRPGRDADERLVRSVVRLPTLPLALENHAAGVLEGLGFTAEEIDALIDAGVVSEEGSV
ncbi:MAG: CoA transferase [Deltaproteobacteria bacterium]|nr:CoA transferase [Deltaproteobacteria bacterium]